MQGWKDYLATPAAGNKLIKEANPKMEDDQIAYSIARFKAIKCITGGDAATMGIGTMTEARLEQNARLHGQHQNAPGRCAVEDGIHDAIRQRVNIIG
jgi:hypothetical protein